MDLRKKIISVFVLSVIIPFVIVSMLVLLNVEEVFEKEALEAFDAIANIEEQRIIDRFEAIKREIVLVTSRTQLKNSFEAYGRVKESVERERVRTILTDVLAGSPHIKTITAFSPDKQPFLSVGEAHEEVVGVFGTTTEYIDLHEADDGYPLIHFRSPVARGDVVVGHLDFYFDSLWLRGITSDYFGLGDTGEVVIATKAGDNIRFLTPLRQQESLTILTAEEAKGLPMEAALRGEEIVINNSIDYRGETVVAVTRNVDGIGWGIVVKKDRSEILSQIYNLVYQFVFSGILLAFFVAGIAYYLAESTVAPIMQLVGSAKHLMEGSFDRPIRVSAKGEIGMLAQTLESMRASFQNLYSGLESKVKEKTVELETRIADSENSKRALANLLEDLEVEKENVERERIKDNAILSSIGDAMIATDQYASVTRFNRRTELMLGFAAADLLGRKITATVRLEDIKNQKPIPIEDTPLIRALETGEPVQGTYYVVRKDGTKFPASITVSPIIHNEKPLGSVEIIRDVTHEIEIDKAKSEFVSLASHQLRTPLSIIGWYAEILLAGDGGRITADQRKYLNEIYNSNRRMVELVNALLNVSRIELGTLAVDPQETDPVEVAETTVSELLPQIKARKQVFKKEYPKGKVTMSSDPKLLKIILQNLLSNAVKYTPEKGTVSLTMKEEEKNIIIEVKDTGYGIPVYQQDKVFQKLFRADNVREKDTEGTGLGMYLVKSIVDSFGGTISFVSGEGDGTTFTIVLPKTGLKKQEGAKTLIPNA